MIYFMQAPTGGPIKIGKSVNVEQRHAWLQHHYAAELVVLGTIDGYDDEETEIHARFAHLRIRRTEQFRAAQELVDFIGAGIVDDGAEKELKVGGEQQLKPARLDLSLETHRLLRRVAAHEGVSMTQWVRDCVNNYIDGERARLEGNAALIAQES